MHWGYYLLFALRTSSRQQAAGEALALGGVEEVWASEMIFLGGLFV